LTKRDRAVGAYRVEVSCNDAGPGGIALHDVRVSVVALAQD
jgi:hypothetical protein